MFFNSKITHIETYTPKNYIDIKSFSIKNKWDFDKIYEKTGIKKVYRADKNQTTLDLAFNSANKLVKKIDRNIIDAVICVTQSSNYFLPSLSCILQDKLKLKKNIIAFDINQGCSGYINALYLAISYINSGISKNILIICADTYSKFLNPGDRSVVTLFSDASSSTLVSKCKKKYFGKFNFGTDGSGSKHLYAKNSKTCNDKSDLYMNGSSIYSFTQSKIPNHIKKNLINNRISINSIDKFIFHQASKLVLDSLSKSLKVEEKLVLSNLKNLGNTISSSIPFLLKYADQNKSIINGSKLSMCGFGVGLSWGSCVYEWKCLK